MPNFSTMRTYCCSLDAKRDCASAHVYKHVPANAVENKQLMAARAHAPCMVCVLRLATRSKLAQQIIGRDTPELKLHDQP